MRDLDQFFSSNAQPMAIGATKARRDIDRRLDGEIVGYRFPVPTLDELVRLIPQEFTLIAARASVGKTALALQVLEGVDKQRRDRGEPGISVFFSAEMSHAALVLRLASARCGVSLHDFYTVDQMPADDLRKLRDTVDVVEREVGVFVDETSSPTLSHMIEQLEALSAEAPITCVVFDYVELSGEGLDQNDTRRIALITRGLKRIAKMYDCPVVALSQFNRDIEKRSDPEPRLSDIMYGGEREADKVIGLARKEDQPGIVGAYVLKNRNGKTGSRTLYFKGSEMKFYAAVRVELNPREE